MLVQRSLILFCISVIAIPATFADFNWHRASLGKYGHHVSIRIKGEHACSGSIINAGHILTSYTCIFITLAEDITVVVGTHFLNTGGDSYKIEKTITPDSISDDIALLRTQKDIIYRDGVTKVAIANHNRYDDDYPLTFTGWEHPQMGETRKNDMLQEFFTLLYNKDKCRQENELSHDKYMCIYDPAGQQFCNIDQGGAIMADGYLVGIYLDKGSCYNASEPKAHTPVYEYADWIRNNTIVEPIIREYHKSPQEILNILGILMKSQKCNRQYNSLLALVALKKKLDHNAPEGAYPYHVSIRHNGQHICSGSIINKFNVLTSINCLMRFANDDLFVMVGINSLKENGVMYQVEKIIPPTNDKYDISILRIATPIIFNDRVSSIPIVKNRKQLVKLRNIILSGWERTNPYQNRTDKLQQISFQIYNTKHCKHKIPFLNKAYMCSIKPSSSNACSMDYGSPIVANGVQVALNPFTIGCENSNEPHFHLPLYKHSSWIEVNSRVWD